MLILEGEQVQVVQQVIHKRSAVHRVQARFVQGAQARVHSQVGEVHEGVQDEVLQEFVVVPAAFETIRVERVRGLTRDRIVDRLSGSLLSMVLLTRCLENSVLIS